MKGVKFFRPANEVVRYLTLEQFSKLLAEADRETPYLRDVIEMAIHTGLRRRHLLNLRFDQCDMEARVIRIEHFAKNKRAAVVPMNDTVYGIVQRRKAPAGESLYLFPNDDPRFAGKPLLDVKKAFKTALRRAGITAFRFHDLRHTTGAWHVLYANTNIRMLQQLLGHSTLKQTERYTGLRDDALAAQAKALDNLVPKSCLSEAVKNRTDRQPQAKKNNSKQLIPKPKKSMGA